MGLQGVRKVGLLALKEGLLKLDIGITHEEAMKLSDELADEQREV